MKIVHWTAFSGSGMDNVARSISKAECSLGLDSVVCNPLTSGPVDYAPFLDADIHVAHTHFPPAFQRLVKKSYKLVYVAHGTIENIFNSSFQEGVYKPHGCGDGLMLLLHWLREANSVVTFWPRHQAILRTMTSKNTKVHCVPMGVERDFWKAVPSQGHFAGSPAIFSAENSHPIKWPLDLLLTWPLVYPRLKGNPSLHVCYLPQDQHRWFFPLADANGAAYGSHISSITYQGEALRNVFVSIEFYIGLVLKGDYNRICLEANSTGCKTISYHGNPYTDFWVTEGDQRVVADELVSIINGEVEPRKKDAVPDIAETAKAMKSIYETL